MGTLVVLSTVPRYFFHLHNDIDVPDEEGKDLPDLDAARGWAAGQARILAGETLKEKGSIVLRHYIDVEDSNGAVLATVAFGDVVTIER